DPAAADQARAEGPVMPGPAQAGPVRGRCKRRGPGKGSLTRRLRSCVPMTPVRRASLLLALMGCALALPGTASAALRTPKPLVATPPQSTYFPDRVIDSGAITARAARTPSAYQAPDGTTIQVSFDAAYRE